MNYYLDTEFNEYELEITAPSGKKFQFNTIELISIGIVDENNREYYSICKEFNVQSAWGNEWLKENVLKPIFNELVELSGGRKGLLFPVFRVTDFTILLNEYGKTKKQIADEIKSFIFECSDQVKNWGKEIKPKFYAYYADYDWVVFCWLYGRMMDLPKGFPMYCNDLKQELDRVCYNKYPHLSGIELINHIENHPDYPKQINEHNALDDARWNKKLHEFINNIK